MHDKSIEKFLYFLGIAMVVILLIALIYFFLFPEPSTEPMIKTLVSREELTKCHTGKCKKHSERKQEIEKSHWNSSNHDEVKV